MTAIPKTSKNILYVESDLVGDVVKPTIISKTPTAIAIIPLSQAPIINNTNFLSFNPFKTSAQRAVPIDNRNTTIQSTITNLNFISKQFILRTNPLTGNFNCQISMSSFSQATGVLYLSNILKILVACDLVGKSESPHHSRRATGESLNYGKQDGSSYGDEDSNDYSAGSEPAASSISSKLSGDGIRTGVL